MIVPSDLIEIPACSGGKSEASGVFVGSIEFYADRALDKKPPYSVFQVKDYDCVITLYESGKVMFQGLGADIEASMWKDLENHFNDRDIDNEVKAKEEKDRLETNV